MSQITFVSSSHNLSSSVRAIADEMNIDLNIVEGIMMEDGWMNDWDFQKPDTPLGDVLVSRGGTAFYLSRNLKKPVVSINPGPFDYLECCKAAKRYSNNIAITSFHPLLGLDLIAEVLGVSIAQIHIRTLKTLEDQIAALAREGDFCVVGGGASILCADKHGLPNVFLHMSPDSIREALQRARELADLHHEVNRRATRLETILGCSYEGIVAVDSTGCIDLFNNAAERILGIPAKSTIGKKFQEVIPHSRLGEVLENGQSQINQVQSHEGIRIVTNRVAVYDGQRIAGAVATFQEESHILQIEHKLRKETAERQFRARMSLDEILGSSPAIRRKKDLARKFASSDLTVFINGPSGTGKELFAQGIHSASRRADGAFVAVNCGALPPSLLESELFGYADGAFTGAKRKGKAGLFELAHGGTIFLDEIDAMSLDMQGRFLRVLQEREVLRIGAEGIIPVDIRVIAASNKSPKELLESKLIREDLYYRLNVLYLEVPPLCERKEDIPILCRSFLPDEKRDLAVDLLAEMMPYLQAYSWPGNVRELLNFTQRLTFFLDEYRENKNGTELMAMIAPELVADPRPAVSPDDGLRARLASKEEAMIEDALKECATLGEAARRLGLPKTTLWRKTQRMKGR